MKDDRNISLISLLLVLTMGLVVGIFIYFEYFRETAGFSYNWSDLSSADEKCEVTLLSSFDGQSSVLWVRDDSSLGLARLEISFTGKKDMNINYYIQFSDGYDTKIDLKFSNARGEVYTFNNIEKDFLDGRWYLVQIDIFTEGNATTISIDIDGDREEDETIISVYEDVLVNKATFVTDTSRKENIYIDILEIG